MPAPIDYSIGVVDPGAAAQQGFAFGAGMRDKEFGDQQRTFQFQQQQQAAERLAQQRKDLATLAANPHPTARDYAAVVLKYPELKDSFKDSQAAVSSEQKQQRLDAAAPIFAAFQAGRTDLAQALLQKQVDALRNSNAPEREIKAAETWLQMAKEAPATAANIGGIYLASVMGPEKFEATFGKIGSEARENAAAPGLRKKTDADAAQAAAAAAKASAEAGVIPERARAEIANINSQITERGGRLALDTDRLVTETSLRLRELTQKAGELHPDARKLANEAAGASVMASNTAVQMRGLADQFEKADPASGALGTVNEAFATFTGSQDYVSQLRKEYTRIRMGQVLSMLPPGPASDRDIQQAQAGFLKDTANPKEIASWLRGVAKLQDYQAQYEDARAEWVVAMGHLGKATKDIEVNGVKVAAGTTLSDFVRKTLKAPGPVTEAPPPAKETNYMDKYGKPPGNEQRARRLN